MIYFIKHYWYLLILGLFLIIFLTMFFSSMIFKASTNNMVKDFNDDVSIESNGNIITLDDLSELPLPVRQWLIKSQIVGKEMIQYMTFTQTGSMRLKEDSDEWVDSLASQYINVREPSFLWHVNVDMMPIIDTLGRDTFIDGLGSMKISLSGLIPVVNESDNEKINLSSMHRFLLELPFYPTAALEDYITWESIDDSSAKAIMSIYDKEVEVVFYFKENNEIDRVEALRYKDTDEDATKKEFIGYYQGTSEVEGMIVSNKASLVWMLDDSPYEWYRLENKNISIN